MSSKPSSAYIGYGFFIPNEQVYPIFYHLINNFTAEEHEGYFDTTDSAGVTLGGISDITKQYSPSNPLTEDTEQVDLDEYISEFYGPIADFILSYVLENSAKPENEVTSPNEASYLWSSSFGWDWKTQSQEGIVVYVDRTDKLISWDMHSHGEVSELTLADPTQEEIDALLHIQKKMNIDYPISNKYWARKDYTY